MATHHTETSSGGYKDHDEGSLEDSGVADTRKAVVAVTLLRVTAPPSPSSSPLVACRLRRSGRDKPRTERHRQRHHSKTRAESRPRVALRRPRTRPPALSGAAKREAWLLETRCTARVRLPQTTRIERRTRVRVVRLIEELDTGVGRAQPSLH